MTLLDYLLSPVMRRLDRLEAVMSQALDTLEAEVAKTRTVVESVKALLAGLVTQIGDAKNDPAQIQRILDEVTRDNADLAAAVAQNTPGQPPTP